MPEGHSIRYFANVHERCFQGLPVTASSPQGRFADGAASINGRTLLGTTTHGKHLFFHFEERDEIVHIHLGLYGWFNIRRNRGGQPRPSARLRLENEMFVSELVGPTKCEHLTTEQMLEKTAKLGGDPLHDNGVDELTISKIRSSKKSIASLLMNQSIIAGIGNVYRAELLFLEKLNPDTRGCDVPEETIESIWERAAVLMADGATDGMIRTVHVNHLSNEELSDSKYTQYSYVYKRHGLPCRICSDEVQIGDVDGRKLYWCPTCQK